MGDSNSRVRAVREVEGVHSLPVQIVQLRYEVSVAETRVRLSCATVCHDANTAPNATATTMRYLIEELCANSVTVEKQAITRFGQ